MTKLFTEMTEAERNEVRMFGCTKADMKETVESELFVFNGKRSQRDAAMMAMSIMSDCQEMLNRDNGGTYDFMTVEDVRQALNRAKWILSTYVKEGV
jgi:hypothetical protein